MKNMENKGLFRKEDRVWDLLLGWGTVIGTKKEYGIFPVLVKFDIGKHETYTIDGKSNDGLGIRRLFFEEIPIPASALERPRKIAKEMLEECEEVEFRFNRDNFYIYADYKNKICYTNAIQWCVIGVKYISEKDAERIIRECKENN